MMGSGRLTPKLTRYAEPPWAVAGDDVHNGLSIRIGRACDCWTSHQPVQQ